MSYVRPLVGLVALCGLSLALPATASAQVIRNHHNSGNSGKAAAGGKQWFGTTGVGIAAGRTSGGGLVVQHGIGGGAVDETPPVITVPDDMVVPTLDDACHATVNIPEVVVVDDRDRNPRVTVTFQLDPAVDIDPAGEGVDEVNIGSYDVRVVAIDRYGNRAQASFRVDVVDRTAPTFDPAPDPAPADDPIEAVSPLGTGVGAPFDCIDACDNAPEEAVAPNIRRFQLGSTDLVATCTDNAGNERRHEFSVNIVDTTPPRPQRAPPEALEAECQDPEGALFDVPALVWIDNGTSADDLVVALIVNPDGANERYDEIPDELRLRKGIHVLRYTAEDESGNVATVDVEVEITDNGAPEIDIVEAPDSGWIQPGQEVVLEVSDGCAPPDQAFDVAIVPQPDNIVRDGNRFTLTFQNEGLYRLRVTVEDPEGNVGQNNEVNFGIDGSAPVATIAVPSQNGVNGQDDVTYPIWPRAEVIAVNTGGAEEADGIASGIANVTAVLNPDGEAPRTLADHDFEGEGVPKQGDRVVAGIGCELQVRNVEGVNVRDDYCNRDVELDLREIPVGVHVIEVTVSDFAGNEDSTRGYFINSTLVDGIPRINARLAEAAQGAPIPVQQRIALATARLNQALEIADITDDSSDYDTPVFLGGSLRKVQDSMILLGQAMGLAQGASRAKIRESMNLLLRLAGSDTKLLQGDAAARNRLNDPAFLRAAYTADTERADSALDLAEENRGNDEYNSSMSNVLIGYFYAKNTRAALEMNYRFAPNGLALDDVFAEYERARDVLEGIIAELNQYQQLADAPAQAIAAQVRDRITQVKEMLDQLVEHRFVGPGGGNGVTDGQYVNQLINLLSVANSTLAAANQGMWIRNYQWWMMQIVRFMTQASMESAIAVHGAGRPIWDLYATGLGLVERGIGLLDDRAVQAVIELYGQDTDVLCLLYAVYHCDYIQDEGEADRDRAFDDDEIPEVCHDRMFFPTEWADQPRRDRLLPQCQYFPDADADDYRE